MGDTYLPVRNSANVMRPWRVDAESLLIEHVLVTRRLLKGCTLLVRNVNSSLKQCFDRFSDPKFGTTRHLVGFSLFKPIFQRCALECVGFCNLNSNLSPIRCSLLICVGDPPV